MKNVVTDATFILEEVLKQRHQLPVPQEILNRQRIVKVYYFSFDGKLHQGQIVVDMDLVEDIKAVFDLIRRMKFPVYSVIPLVDKRFMSDDEKSMSLNNSSGFNYRLIANSTKISNHAYGRAIDINPLLNPFIKKDFVQPAGAKYNPKIPGTITADSKLVLYFKSKGWEWGGDWTDRKDYQHFQKPV